MVSYRTWLPIVAWGAGALVLGVGAFGVTTTLVVGGEPQPATAPALLVPLDGDPFAEGEETTGPASDPAVFERPSAFPAPTTDVVEPDPVRDEVAGGVGSRSEHHATTIDLSAVPEAEPTVDVVLPGEDGGTPLRIDDLVADDVEGIELDLPGPIPADDATGLAGLLPSTDDPDGTPSSSPDDLIDDPTELVLGIDPDVLVGIFDGIDADDPLLDVLLGGEPEDEACEGWFDCGGPLGWWSGSDRPFFPSFVDPCAALDDAAPDPDDPIAQLRVVGCDGGVAGTVLQITSESRLSRLFVVDATRGFQYDVRCEWDDDGHPLLLTSDEPIVAAAGQLSERQFDDTYDVRGRFEVAATSNAEVERWRAGDLEDLDHWAARRVHTCVTVDAPETRLHVEVTATLTDGVEVSASTEIQQGLGTGRVRPPIELTGSGSSLFVTVPLASEQNEVTSDVTALRADGVHGTTDCAGFDAKEDASILREQMATAQGHSYHEPGRATFPLDRRARARPDYPYLPEYDLRQLHALRIPAGVPHYVCVRTLVASSFGPGRVLDAQQFVVIPEQDPLDVKITANGGSFRRAVAPGEISVVVTHPRTNRELTDGVARGCWANVPRSPFAAGDRGRDPRGGSILCQTAGYGDMWPDEVDVRVTVGEATQLQRIPIDRSRGPWRETFLVPVTAERRVCGESIFGSSCGNRDDVGELAIEVEYTTRQHGRVGAGFFATEIGEYGDADVLDTAALPDRVRIDTSLRRVPGGVEPASLLRPISPWAAELYLVPDRDVTVRVVHEGQRCRPAAAGSWPSMSQRVADGERLRLDPVDHAGVEPGTVSIAADRRSRIPIGDLCPGEVDHLAIVLDDDEGRRTILRNTPPPGEAGGLWVQFPTTLWGTGGLVARSTLEVRFVHGPDPAAPRALVDVDLRVGTARVTTPVHDDVFSPNRCLTRSSTFLRSEQLTNIGMIVPIDGEFRIAYDPLPSDEEWALVQRAANRMRVPAPPPCVSTQHLDEGGEWRWSHILNRRAGAFLREPTVEFESRSFASDSEERGVLEVRLDVEIVPM